MDPDRRIREALNLVFRKFNEVGSVRQVAVWLRQESVQLPTIAHGAQGRIVEWRLPGYNSVHRILTNPVYAGAYVFGRTASRTVMEAGRKVVKVGVRRHKEEWSVLIRDHHEGYVTWQQFERNLRLIGDNANMKGAMVPGSVRNGGGLLAGLLRCGHCGRKLTVQHNGLRGVARYLCNGASVNHAARDKCITFGNMRVDAAVSAEALRVISPLAMEAALESAWVPTESLSSSSPWSRPASRRLVPDGNIMRLSRKTGSWPVNWSAGGTSGWEKWRGWKTKSGRRRRRSPRKASPKPNGRR
jgi:hypothetical protein